MWSSVNVDVPHGHDMKSDGGDCTQADCGSVAKCAARCDALKGKGCVAFVTGQNVGQNGKISGWCCRGLHVSMLTKHVTVSFTHSNNPKARSKNHFAAQKPELTFPVVFLKFTLGPHPPKSGLHTFTSSYCGASGTCGRSGRARAARHRTSWRLTSSIGGSTEVSGGSHLCGVTWRRWIVGAVTYFDRPSCIGSSPQIGRAPFRPAGAPGSQVIRLGVSCSSLRFESL